MRIGRVWLARAWLLVAATPVVLIALAWPAGYLTLGLAGGVTGALGGLAALRLGLLGGAMALGVGVRRVVVGVGPRVAEWGGPTRPVALRAVPLVLSVTLGPGRTPVRRRMWWAALCSVVTGTATLVTALVAAATTGSAALAGMATGCGLAVAHALLPRRTATATSPGWYLLRTHRMSDRHVARLDAAPLVDRVVEAAQAGELAIAERLAAGLAERHPELPAAIEARIAVLEALGRYSEAMVLAVKLASQDDQEPHEAAASFAALAGLACATVEAGQLDTELGLSTATQAMANARTLGYPSARLNGARALVALLRGNLDNAIRLARRSAGSTDDVFCRADDLATLARAHMAAGDNRMARRVLGEAEKLVPWWPRVAKTRRRLEVC